MAGTDPTNPRAIVPVPVPVGDDGMVTIPDDAGLQFDLVTDPEAHASWLKSCEALDEPQTPPPMLPELWFTQISFAHALDELQTPPPPAMRTAEEVERISDEILKSYRNYLP